MNNQRTISVSRYPPSCSTTSSPDRLFTTWPVSSKKTLGTTTVPVAAHRDEMAFAQLLMHLGDRNAEQIGDGGQVVDGLAGVKNIVGGRNAAHRIESKSQRATR